jgi:hypothetical protein
MRRSVTALALGAALLPLVPLSAQTLSQRVAALGDGRLRLSFAARPGVCSGGHGITIMGDDDDDDDWQSDCERGPVRVSIQVRGGRVAGADTHLGGRWRSAPGTTDLGTLPARQAAADLLALTETSRSDTEELMTAATLADSAVVWPELLRLARRTDLPLDTRRHAIFWLGQAAGEAATRGLDSLANDHGGDVEIRKQAVFALSQRPADEGVPALIHIARTSPQREIRKSALFWLGHSGDPRALALFEELLQ